MRLKAVSMTFASILLAAAMSAQAEVRTNQNLAASAPDAEETCLIIICCNSWRCYWRDL